MLRIRTKTHPTRPGVFVASFEGRTLCASRTPLADGARALIAMGFPPVTLVTMRHEGSNHDAFIPEPLANWAARAFVEGPHGPRLVAFRNDSEGEGPTPEETPPAAD